MGRARMYQCLNFEQSEQTLCVLLAFGNIRLCSQIAKSDGQKTDVLPPYLLDLTPPCLHAANVTCNGPSVFLHARKLQII